MAFPVVESRITGADTANVTSRSITLPSGIVVGELLLACVAADGVTGTATSSSGWVELGDAVDAADVGGAIYYKVATGSDALSVTSSSEQLAWVSFRVSGAASPPTGSSVTGSSANSNPPNHAPAGGAKDYLWIAVRCGDGTVQASAAPSGYGNLQTKASTGVSGQVAIATAERALNASAEDPGTFTSSTEQWVCWTLAVAPAVASALLWRPPRSANYRR